MESYQLRNIHIGEEKAKSDIRVYSWGTFFHFVMSIWKKESHSRFNMLLRIKWTALSFSCRFMMAGFVFIGLRGTDLIIFTCLLVIGFIQIFFINL